MARGPNVRSVAKANDLAGGAARVGQVSATNRKDPYMDGSGGWGIPTFDNGMTFKDMGSSGLRQFGGWVREEFLPQLQGRQAARVFREMFDNSPIVGAVIFAIAQSMRKVEWRCNPANDTPAAKEAAEWADSLRTDMSTTWEEFMTEALTMLVYGFAPHEIVLKRRLGMINLAPGTANSRYDDGYVGVRKLPIRGQDTVIKWFFDTNGEILGLTQQPWVGPMIDLPIEKLLLFRPFAHKNNPEGRSILRTAYRPYYFVKRMEEQEAILLERMSGFPVVYVPSALLEAAAAGDALAVAQLAAYKKLVTNIRIDEQMGALLPSDVYSGPNGPSNVRMYEFKLEVPQGRPLIDPDVTITRHKLDILMSTMTDFLVLGHQSRGTQNLSLNKVDMFFQAIEGWLNSVAAVLNQSLLPRVWMINGFDMDLMPEYVPDLAQRVDLDVLSNFILRLSQSGMALFPDMDLENFIREAAGLPNLADESEWASLQDAKLTAEQAAQAQVQQQDEIKKLFEAGDPEKIKKAMLAFVARHVLQKRSPYKSPMGKAKRRRF